MVRVKIYRDIIYITYIKSPAKRYPNTASDRMSSWVNFVNDFNELLDGLEWLQPMKLDRIRTYRLNKDLIMLSYYND